MMSEKENSNSKSTKNIVKINGWKIFFTYFVKSNQLLSIQQVKFPQNDFQQQKIKSSVKKQEKIKKFFNLTQAHHQRSMKLS